jgi:hypothetical protein
MKSFMKSQALRRMVVAGLVIKVAILAFFAMTRLGSDRADALQCIGLADASACDVTTPSIAATAASCDNGTEMQ